jgi:hypothetical protein
MSGSTTERQRHGRSAVEVTADEVVVGEVEFEGSLGRVIEPYHPMLAGEGEHTEDAPDTKDSFAAVDALAEKADVRAGRPCPLQECFGRARRSRRLVLVLDPVMASALDAALPQELRPPRSRRGFQYLLDQPSLRAQV